MRAAEDATDADLLQRVRGDTPAELFRVPADYKIRGERSARPC